MNVRVQLLAKNMDIHTHILAVQLTTHRQAHATPDKEYVQGEKMLQPTEM